MRVYEREFDLRLDYHSGSLFSDLQHEIAAQTGEDELPIRFAVTAMGSDRCRCEVGLLAGVSRSDLPLPRSIFDFSRRAGENIDTLNVVMLVPTGIGCEIGGHAGDAGPAARLIGTVCDRLILHPNVVNGADLNEMPENALYVEGSSISFLLQGTIGLQPVRSNRVLVVVDGGRESCITDAVINSVNAARAVYGLTCSKTVTTDPPVRLRSEFTTSGRAGGSIEGLERLLAVLEQERGRFDAIALSGAIELPFHLYMQYLRGEGELVNPLGGVEAIYTHALSLMTGVPAAHAPMYVASVIPDDAPAEWLPTHPGIVDPRIAAEVISTTFFQSVLKGLQRSPRILPIGGNGWPPGVLSAADITCLVIPEGVLGLPVLAALQQGIPVIAVRENRNRMRNDLDRLPWAAGQYMVVENYLEAAGALAALKAGLSLESVRRPLKKAVVEESRAAVPSRGPDQ